MINELFKKIVEGFNFKVRDLFVLLIIVGFAFGVYSIYTLVDNTNDKICAIEERYFNDVEDNAFTVLASLQKNNIFLPEDILEFLSDKPAGRSDLKKGLENELIYTRLTNVYDGLAKNAKQALIY